MLTIKQMRAIKPTKGRPGKYDKANEDMTYYDILKVSKRLEFEDTDPQYQATEHELRLNLDGKWVYDRQTRHFVTPHLDASTGRYHIHIWHNGDFRELEFARIMAQTFSPRGYETNVVHHIDGDKTNDNRFNLIWVTYKEHARLHKHLRQGNRGAYKSDLIFIGVRDELQSMGLTPRPQAKAEAQPDAESETET